MKKIQTINHKKIVIGNGERTVGLNNTSKTQKSRIQPASRIASKKTSTGARTGCSGCSRNKK